MKADDPGTPRIIQGGMGVAISAWPLARAVSRTGQLGVVSGTALEIVCARRLQQGDPGGHVRRALAHFPVPGAAERILRTYYVAEGKAPQTGYRPVLRFTLNPAPALQELTVAANFVEVFLAKEGHDGLALAGGERALRLATTADLATVTITSDTSMGVTYPVETSCEPPHRPPGVTVTGGSALERAERAYRTALESAVRHAAALEALRVVDREIATTRQRVRALDRRWIPQLRQAIADLELALEEQDRAEGLTRRRARNRAVEEAS